MTPGQQAKEIADAAESVSGQIQKHGFPVVLATTLLAIVLAGGVYFFRHWSVEQQQWREASSGQLTELNASIEIERKFVREQLTNMIERNIEATQKHTTAIETLTDEIKRK